LQNGFIVGLEVNGFMRDNLEGSSFVNITYAN